VEAEGGREQRPESREQGIISFEKDKALRRDPSGVALRTGLRKAPLRNGESAMHYLTTFYDRKGTTLLFKVIDGILPIILEPDM
jgi:hypothetical protein